MSASYHPGKRCMPRAQRLLDLSQILRCHRFPVAGAQLAAGTWHQPSYPLP